MRLLLASLFSLQAYLVLANSVVEFEDTDFNTFFSSPSHPPILLEFSAPWCGKCKDLSPELEKAARAFERFKGKVVFARIDADSFRDIADTFDIKAYPTIKWFPAGATKPLEDYLGPHSASSIIHWVNGKANLNAVVKTERKDAVILTPETFDKVVMDPSKDVLVLFHAPWSGHCKLLNPIIDQVATAFSDEDGVVVAKIDGDKYREIEDRFGVTGFPTIRFFQRSFDGSPKKARGEDYVEGRDTEGFVDFLNRHAGTQRTKDGRVHPAASTHPGIQKFMEEFASNPRNLKHKLDLNGNDHISTLNKEYVRVLEKVSSEGIGYLVKEAERLETILEFDNLSPQQVTRLSNRLNIIFVFIEALVR